MSIADKYRPQFTYDDYVLWAGKMELIDGMPHAMSPASAPYHQGINAKLVSNFNDSLNTNCGENSETFSPIDGRSMKKL